MEAKSEKAVSKESGNAALRLARMIVVDELDPTRMILVAMYGFGGVEKFVAGLSRVTNGYDDPLHSGVGKYVFVQGVGDKFCLPDTRLDVDDSKFWLGVLDGYVARSYSGAQFRPAMVNKLAKQCYVARIHRTGGFEGSEQFTALTKTQARDFWEARKNKPGTSKSPAVSSDAGKTVTKRETAHVSALPPSGKITARVKDAAALKEVASVRAVKESSKHVYAKVKSSPPQDEELSEEEVHQTYSSEEEESDEPLVAAQEDEGEEEEEELILGEPAVLPLVELLSKDGFLPLYVTEPSRSFANKPKWAKLKDDVMVIESWAPVHPGDETFIVSPSTVRPGGWKLSTLVKWTASGNALVSPSGSRYALLK